MSRYKGSYKDWQKREDFPHLVEIRLPNGLGRKEHPFVRTMWSSRFSNMHTWCNVRAGLDGYCTTGRRERVEPFDEFVQFRFKEPAAAEEFRAVYGDDGSSGA